MIHFEYGDEGGTLRFVAIVVACALAGAILGVAIAIRTTR